MSRYTPPIFWRACLENVRVPEPIHSMASVVVLLASMAGCASSLERVDWRAWPANSRGSARVVVEAPPGEFIRDEACDGGSSARDKKVEIANERPPIDRQVPMPSSDIDSPPVRQFLPMQPRQWDPYLEPQHPPHPLLGDVLADHVNYYSCRNLGTLTVGVGIAAAMANTGLDRNLQDHYQENLRDIRTDEYSEAIHTSKVLGNGYIMIPAFAGAVVVGSWFDEVPLGCGLNEWGERSLRTILVGAPPMLAMQIITGASRPDDIGKGSQWRPFQASNGVSGHSFMGAVPFISAAKMTDDPFWKVTLYCGSALAGLSRINDNRHYPSQVMLGWWMAYVAATAVDQTEQEERNLSIFPLPMDDGMGVGVEYRW